MEPPSSPGATAPPLLSTADEDSSERIAWVLIFYLAVVPALWIAPLVFSFLRRRLRGDKPATASPDDASLNKLEVAEQARKRLRARVSGTVWQVGWMIFILSVTPYLAAVVSQYSKMPIIDIQPVVGNFIIHWTFAPFGLVLVMLSVQPTEAQRIDNILRFTIVLNSVFSIIYVVRALSFINDGWTAYGMVILCIPVTFIACMIIPSAHSLYGHKCCGGDPPPPRRKLQRLWLCFRLGFLLFATTFMLPTGIFRLSCFGDDCIAPLSHYIMCSVGWLSVSLTTTAAIRGRVTRWLGSLGKSGTAEQQAASVASLLGDTSVAKAFATAAQCFRALPLSTLTLATLTNNEPDPSLHNLTVPAVLGGVDAFMSHSWSDDGKLKYERLHEWARELVGNDDVQIWLDKVRA